MKPAHRAARRGLLSSALGVLIALAGSAAPAAGHHVGAYTPRDNEVSANFKQLKFSIQARKFDVAQRLFETGPLRPALRDRAAALPAGLEERIGAALAVGDGPAAEAGLAVFVAALARELALEAERQVADPALAAPARVAAGRKFLEAIWRYYNLIDFVVSQRDPKAAVGIRLAFDEAEGYVKPPVAGAPALDPLRLREPFQRIARILTGVVEAPSPSARRSP
jgi:hypothetical protein